MGDNTEMTHKPPIPFSGRRLLAAALLALALVPLGCQRQPDPPPPDNEWPTASPESQGLSGSVLEYYSSRSASGYYGQVHSLLVIRHGRLVHEAYFSGYDREQLHAVYSVTKTVTCALIGIALSRGWLSALDEKVLAFFPQYPQPLPADDRKAAMNLRHLLTMQAGLRWDEQSASVDSPQNSLFRLYDAPDWYRYMLDQPMAGPPGEAFCYNSGASILLGGVLQRATGRSAAAIAATELFAPLAIGRQQWDEGSPGVSNTGWGLWLRPRDMAKFGELLLRGGSWKGTEVVPPAWVREMFMNRVELEYDYGYGYQIWMLPLEMNPAINRYEIKIAWGYGGQFIFIVPALDMVVVSTAANFDGDGGAIDFIRDLLSSAVLD
jgi:CubicO group peptidase (beta-lactamase class C family)